MPAFMARFPRWTRRVLRRADLIVTPSSYLARALEPYGYTARIVPNLVDASRYPFRQRTRVRPRVLWMRAFHPIYNPYMALRVLAVVRTMLPDASLTMAGQDKGFESSVRKQAARLGLSDAVIDNTPVSVIEAFAMGLPVVSTDVGGIRDLLGDGVCGLLVPDDDVQAMAAAILRLVRDPQLSGRLSSNGRSVAEGSSWEQIHAQWERLFSELVGDARKCDERQRV